MIDATLVDDPPALAREGGFTRDGVDPDLDALRTISRSGKQVIVEMEERERARTGINSLKVRYNRVFGYYIEISKSNLHAVPPDYHRKQTIAGGERFVTPALKEYEEKILGADERILELELSLFEKLRAAVANEAPRIQASARALATLDVLAALAETAAVNNYIKPLVHEGDEMIVTDARHPVVERRTAAAGEAFVPNDVTLDGSACQLVILTGPNMGGKSTYLRQTALLVRDGADRVVRAGTRRQDRAGRSDLCAGGRFRQHRQGAFHVHGRNAGDREHPAQRDVEKPRRARRDRSRYRNLRRPQPRLGGRRTSGDQPEAPPEDVLCDALPRVD